MIERCHLAAAEISELGVLSHSTVKSAVSQLGPLKVTRLIVTDHNGLAIYDSATPNTPPPYSYVLFPEIVQALQINNAFSYTYHDGAMESRAATPVISFGALNGCVYMMEYDTTQGALMQSLQNNILAITLVLESVVILFSLAFAKGFDRRMRQIMDSIRIFRDGDYTHRVKIGGRDELTFLGDEFNELTERLQKSENKRRQFVSDASHELKTPLASIKLLTDSILQNDMDIGTIREFVGDIGSEADRLNRMSQKLLSLSRIETQADGDCEIVYMGPTVERVARMLSAIAKECNISMELDLKDDCPILILEDDLYQITFNLAENGIKYNIPGGKLTISVHRSEDNAILTVSDTGMGIPEEAIHHVFERFYRVDKARSRKTGGSGLGLSIVRSMVERNRGTISVSSVPEQGSTFTVVFPIFDTEEESS